MQNFLKSKDSYVFIGKLKAIKNFIEISYVFFF